MPRPSQHKDYDPLRHPQLIKYMVRTGLNDVEIASEIGITPRTLHNWKSHHPEVKAAFEENRYWVDHLVEESLLKRALGFEYDEVVRKQVFPDDAPEPDVASNVTIIERKITHKHVLPDVQACIFWLTNRQPGRWKQVLQHEHTGKDASDKRRTKRKVFKVLRDPESVQLANKLARRVALSQTQEERN